MLLGNIQQKVHLQTDSDRFAVAPSSYSTAAFVHNGTEAQC